MLHKVFWRSGLILGVLFVSGCSDHWDDPAPDARPAGATQSGDASAADVPVIQPDAATDSRLISDGSGDGLGAIDLGSDSPVLPSDGATSLCGNGIIDPGETCDDGNTKQGDGCSSTCQVEYDWPPPWPCDGFCIRMTYCGDARLDGSEQCDDGNITSGDGCSASCQIEEGWRCPVIGRRCEPICGDKLVRGYETCDDGNLKDGDGCSAYCLIESGDGGIDSRELPRCGDGERNGSEECDDGVNDGAYGGCTADCRLGPYCGDGVRNGAEQCDLGAQNGQTNGQGSCTIDCRLGPYCGDARVQPALGEECDLGNLNGVKLDSNRNPDPSGRVLCDSICRVPADLL